MVEGLYVPLLGDVNGCFSGDLPALDPGLDPFRQGPDGGDSGFPPFTRVGAYPPFWIVRPPGAIDLYATVRGTLLGVVGTTLVMTPPGAGFTIANGFEGVLAGVMLTVTAPAVNIDMTFTVRVNGSGVPGWIGLSPIRTSAPHFTLPVEGPLPLASGAVVDILAMNNAATGPWLLQADLFGWQWGQKLRLTQFGANDVSYP